jgi:uncharacterized protein with ATP-grasp and redox domains
MKIELDCFPCYLKQALDVSRDLTEDVDKHKLIMNETVKLLTDIERYHSSPELARETHKIVKRITGIDDPYKKIKKDSIKASIKLYPKILDFLQEKNNELYWALNISAKGNIIDAAINRDINIERIIEFELEREFSKCDFSAFEEKLYTAKNILIIGDNAGESVFDKVLVEKLGETAGIVYAVRSGPIINDATYDDAIDSGLDKCSKIISSGCDAPGLLIKEADKEFLNVYENADIVISKGMGNYETLSDEKRTIFFLLKAKCQLVAEKIGVGINEYVFIKN